ncbi:MAG: hypothetical protein AAGF10_02700, partial [Verrucomicrobiota bacterium]
SPTATVDTRPRGRTGSASEDGFTIVELVVGTLIASLIAALAWAGYASTSRLLAPWQEHVEMQNTLHLVLDRLQQDARYAEAFYLTGDSLLVMDLGTRLVTYRHQDQQLRRDSVSMHSAGLEVTEFSAAFTTGDLVTQPTHPPATDSLRSIWAPHLVHFAIRLDGRYQSLEGATSTTLRHIRPWSP